MIGYVGVCKMPCMMPARIYKDIYKCVNLWRSVWKKLIEYEAETEIPADVSRIMQVLMEADMGSPLEKEEAASWENLYENIQFLDDMNELKPMERHAVIRARQLELEYFKLMMVHSEVRRVDAKAMGHYWLARQQ